MTRVEFCVLKSFCGFVMCLQNQRLSLFPWQFHGSVGSCYCKIETLEYLVGIGAFPPGVGGGGVTPIYKPYRYVPPQGARFLSGGILQISRDRDD